MAGDNDKVMPKDKDDDKDSDIEIISEDDADEEVSEEGSSESDEDEEEDEDEDEEESDESEEEDEESSEDDGEQDKAADLWSDYDEKKTERSNESKESETLVNFRSALEKMAEGEKAEATDILRTILLNPLVAVHTVTEFDFDAAQQDNLSKMQKVFVGAHKNLAVLDGKNAREHYLQVLAVCPEGNSGIWFDLGQKCIEDGDLDMATFAFSRSNDWRSTEALISTNYLRGNYRTCLSLISQEECKKGRFAKGEFLKKKIVSKDPSLSSDIETMNLAYDDEGYEVDLRYEMEANRRLQLVEDRLLSLWNEEMSKVSEREPLEPILISIPYHHSVWDVMTVFCDLYDRINAYSDIFRQPITIVEWESQREKAEIGETVQEIVDIVCGLEQICDQVVDSLAFNEASTSKDNDENFKPEKISARIASKREREKEATTDDETRPASIVSSALDSESEMTELFWLDSRSVEGFRGAGGGTRGSAAPSRSTVTHSEGDNNLHLLELLRGRLLARKHFNIFDAIETCLMAYLDCPCFPRRKAHAAEVLVQTYRRLTRMGSRLLSPRHISLHVLMNEYDDPTARARCLEVFLADAESSLEWPAKEDAIRFAWKYAHYIDNYELKDDLLHFVLYALEATEAEYDTATGTITLAEVRNLLDADAREKRVQSLRELSRRRKYTELTAIVENDLSWSSLSDEESLAEAAALYADALLRTKEYSKLAHFTNRMLCHLLSAPTLPASLIGPWLERLRKVRLDDVPGTQSILPSLGHTLNRLTEHSHLARDWRLWQILHRVIKRIEACRPLLLPLLLDEKGADMDELPTRALRFLSHAHERLSSIDCCAQSDGAFLEYVLDEFRECFSSPAIREALMEKRMSWLAANVQAEINQCLFCAFGRYSKKRRAAADHETGLEMSDEKRRGRGEREWAALRDKALATAMPLALPMHDDRATSFTSDIVELVQNRFPSAIESDDRRKLCTRRLEDWVRNGPAAHSVPPPRDEFHREEKGTDKSEPLRTWPHEGADSQMEAGIFYLIALHYYRRNEFEDARPFIESFLSSTKVLSWGRGVVCSAWALLSHCTVSKMFKMYDDDVLVEWESSVRPLRVALLFVQKSDIALPFMMASTLYQLSTRLARYFDKLPYDDLRLRHSSALISSMRGEANDLFERVRLATSDLKGQGTQIEWDCQWLSYFFRAKLIAKQPDTCWEKVLEYFYEAACSLQLGGALYPPKIAIKNQKYIEPLEVHYHIYATIWKYISQEHSPCMEVLLPMLSYARAFLNHGVAKATIAAAKEFCTTHPDIHSTMSSITFLCSRREAETDVENVLNDTLSMVELVDELKELCRKAFEIITDRFPHYKAYFRLAEMNMYEKDWAKAYHNIFKGVFRRRKKEDDLLESVVEISCTDVDRADSLAYHTTRALRLGLRLARKQKETGPPLAALASLVRTVKDTDEKHVLRFDVPILMAECMGALKAILREAKSNGDHEIWINCRVEVFTLYKSVQGEHELRPLVYVRDAMNSLATTYEGGIVQLERQIEVTGEARRRIVRKRRQGEISGFLSPSTPTAPAPVRVPSYPQPFVPSTPNRAPVINLSDTPSPSRPTVPSSTFSSPARPVDYNSLMMAIATLASQATPYK